MKQQFSYKLNDKQIIKFLQDCHKKIGDLSPLMKTARAFMKKKIEENFDTEGKATGEKWKEWSKPWKKRRIKLKKDGTILTLNGELRKSIMSKSDRNTALVHTNWEYAAVHNFGIDKKVKKKSKNNKPFSCNMTMPKREFMRFDDHAVDELYVELYEKIEDLIEKQSINNLKGN